jgi:hypothetical protein
VTLYVHLVSIFGSISSRGARVILEEPQFVSPSKRLQLLYFLLKNDSSRKTFDRAPLQTTGGRAIEPDLRRSPANQALFMGVWGMMKNGQLDQKAEAAFTSPPNPKYFLLHTSHQIFRRMHGALNVGKKDN